MQTHVKVVAILHIVFGCLGVLAGLFVFALFGGIAGIVSVTEPSSDAAVAIPILGGIGGIVFLVLLAVSFPAILAGFGLLHFKPWARILTIVISVIELLNFPFGTALGFYGIWALLSPEGSALFQGGAPPAGPYSPAPRA